MTVTRPQAEEKHSDTSLYKCHHLIHSACEDFLNCTVKNQLTLSDGAAHHGSNIETECSC